MRYPKLLRHGDMIGVCAPSSGVDKKYLQRLDRAHENVRVLGYKTAESPSVRMLENKIEQKDAAKKNNCVSADAQTRAAELMSMYEDPKVAAIIPPWGGEFLMDMLPFLDFDLLSGLPPKWLSGYSDITTLTFALTLRCDMATLHGSNFLNMGYERIHESDQFAFTAMSETETVCAAQNCGAASTYGAKPKCFLILSPKKPNGKFWAEANHVNSRGA